jgi:hypothetical protein
MVNIFANVSRVKTEQKPYFVLTVAFFIIKQLELLCLSSSFYLQQFQRCISL